MTGASATPAMLFWSVLAAGAQAALLAPATVEGTVYADLDGDGVYSFRDEPVPGVSVWWETHTVAVTDANGRYELQVPADGIVWAATPDGFAPEPSWREVRILAGDAEIDLPLVASERTGPVVFVQASDLHIGTVGIAPTREALRQAIDMTPPPHFLVVTGDLSDLSEDAEFAAVEALLSEIPVPFVPVPGNHDLYDGGPAYRRRFGPPMYAFEAGGVHFVVLNFAASPTDQATFVRRYLSLVGGDPLVIAFTHVPPSAALAAELEDAGVDVLFDGHLHSNRVTREGGMLEITTQTLVLGGIDYTPGGYRVVVAGGAGLAIEHRAVVDRPVATVVHPRGIGCVPAGRMHLLAAVELGGGVPSVVARVDGGPPLELAPVGGWAWSATVEDLVPGAHVVRLEVTSPSGRFHVDERAFCAEPAGAAPPLLDWPQLGGSAAHRGAIDHLPPFPPRALWAAAVGGHLRGGSPIVVDGRVVVPVIDLADGAAGGIVALDAATGEALWDVRVGASVHNAPAAAGGLVVFASADGLVRAVDAADGVLVWSVPLGIDDERLGRWLYAAPVVHDGRVFIGTPRDFVALDLATGEALWRTVPAPGSAWGMTFSAAAIDAQVGLASFGRSLDGLLGWAAEDGAERWRLPRPAALAMHASPVLDDGIAYVAYGGGELLAVDASSGRTVWSRALYPSNGSLSNGLFGTPAISRGRLFVPTPIGVFLALDASTGETLWMQGVGPSVVHPLPYGLADRAYLASPAVTGPFVWAGGADGVLRAFDVVTGELRWSGDLGAPILSGIVPAGGLLVVGTFDGVVRAFATAERATPNEMMLGCGCRVASRGDAGAGRGGAPALAVPLAWALVPIARRRRRRAGMMGDPGRGAA